MSKGPLEDKKMLDYADVARYMGWGPNRAAKWVKSGVLPTVQDPDAASGRLWVPRASLDRWLAEQQGQAAS